MWQDIETAPKDGARVLLWDGTNMEVGKWHGWARDEQGMVIGLDDRIPSRYHDTWIWMSEGFEVNPTHWMPLPPPPGVWQGLGDK